MSDVDFARFQWFTPQTTAPLALTIPNTICMNLNPKLTSQMPSHIEIGVSEDGREICLRAKADNGYKVPKSGSIKDKRLIQALTSTGVHLPARYSIRQDGDCWIGTMDEPAPPSVSLVKPPRKARSKDVHILTEEIGAL